MELFIKVQFWLMLVSFVCRLVVMGTKSFPLKKTESLEEFVGDAIKTLAMLVWAAIVLWVMPK